MSIPEKKIDRFQLFQLQINFLSTFQENEIGVAGFCLSRAPARHQPGCGLRRTHAGVGHTLPKEAGSAYGGGRQPHTECRVPVPASDDLSFAMCFRLLMVFSCMGRVGMCSLLITIKHLEVPDALPALRLFLEEL